MGQRIPLTTIEAATNNFDAGLIIGVGGFGKVYKGILADGTKVAIKKGLARSQQDHISFKTEIELLSQCHHRHLVSLIGYSDENNEMILVYEFMENGTLKSHLYDSGYPSLSWKQRLEICIGAAKGIQTLHNDYPTVVIHRDVKSSNILLDENFMAKVGDFGLSKASDSLDQDHVTTLVRGTPGYLDPEYFKTHRISKKSDVYSFGVVLFEVLCGREVVDTSLPMEETNLVEWALEWQKKGQLENIVDCSLSGNIKRESLTKFGELAKNCVNDKSTERPTIDYVVWKLEHALQLQEATEPNVPQEQSMSRDNIVSEEATTSTHSGTMTGDDDLHRGSLSKVFSNMIKTGPQ